ncbi:MAG: hypothetical protein R2911_13405 [Caldilineaceae bacterium]
MAQALAEAGQCGHCEPHRRQFSKPPPPRSTPPPVLPAAAMPVM